MQRSRETSLQAKSLNLIVSEKKDRPHIHKEFCSPFPYSTVCSAFHNFPFPSSRSCCPTPLPLFALLESLCHLARSKPPGDSPCSNKAALLSMAVMITSFAAAPGVAFCNTIWPLWALVSPI